MFSNETQKAVDTDGKGGWEEVGGVEGKEAIITIYDVEKNNHFQ